MRLLLPGMMCGTQGGSFLGVDVFRESIVGYASGDRGSSAHAHHAQDSDGGDDE